MTLNFCTRTARKIRRLGYARKAAARYAGLFYIFMLLVRGIMGPMNVPSQVMLYRITGSGEMSAGARAGSASPAFSGIHRH
jgi:hypothetical protein